MIVPAVTRFDHAVIAVRDLDAAVEAYRKLGFDTRPGGRHTRRGTHNAIIRFGLDYLELISVIDPDEAAAAGGNNVDLIDFLGRHAGGPLGFAMAADVDRLAASWGPDLVPLVGPYPMERTRADGLLLRWRLLVPGGSAWRRAWPFFIQWETPDADRLRQEAPGRHANGASGVAGVSVAVRSTAAALRIYSRELGLTLVEEGEPDSGNGARRTRLALGDFRIDLLEPAGPGPVKNAVAGEGEGLYEISLAAPAGSAGMLPADEALGARIRLVPALPPRDG